MWTGRPCWTAAPPSITRRHRPACGQLGQKFRMLYAVERAIDPASARSDERDRGADGLRLVVFVYGETRLLPMHEDHARSRSLRMGLRSLRPNICGALLAQFPAADRVVALLYGVWAAQRPDMAFHKFIRAGVRGDTIKIYGDGEQTRDFTYIDDIVEANILAAERGTPEAFTISAGEPDFGQQGAGVAGAHTGPAAPNRADRASARRREPHLCRHDSRGEGSGVRAENSARAGLRRKRSGFRPMQRCWESRRDNYKL